MTYFKLICYLGRIDIIKIYIDIASFTQEELNLALYSGSYEVFNLIAEKVFKSQELLFEYIIQNEIFLKLTKSGNDRFALALMQKYFKLLDKYSKDSKLLDNSLILPIKSGAINPLITGSCPKSRCCARTIARLYEKSPLPNSRGAYVRSSNL